MHKCLRLFLPQTFPLWEPGWGTRPCRQFALSFLPLQCLSYRLAASLAKVEQQLHLGPWQGHPILQTRMQAMQSKAGR